MKVFVLFKARPEKQLGILLKKHLHSREMVKDINIHYDSGYRTIANAQISSEGLIYSW